MTHTFSLLCNCMIHPLFITTLEAFMFHLKPTSSYELIDVALFAIWIQFGGPCCSIHIMLIFRHVVHK